MMYKGRLFFCFVSRTSQNYFSSFEIELKSYYGSPKYRYSTIQGTGMANHFLERFHMKKYKGLGTV